jgi:D-alanyl-D-alanine dipeptidase
LQVRSLYAEQGIPNAPTEIHVRAGVLARLRQAVSHLPTDISLVIFDGYRPLTVQRYLYETYQAEIAAQNPHLAPHELANRVMEFVASPNADPTCPPPHRSGGAVDVYLISRETGEMLPMGTQPDETSPHSITRYFEENPEEPFTTNRRLLFQAMTSAGFTNYRGEWWHYDFGNQRWANCSGTDHALYGIPLSESGFSG